MSDILGNTCEWYRDGQVVSANTWKVGEDSYPNGTDTENASTDWSLRTTVTPGAAN